MSKKVKYLEPGKKMHEMSVIESIINLVKRVCKEKDAKKVLSIHLRIHPYSCLDEDNLNFIFSQLVDNDSVLNEARIQIERNAEIQDREFIVESIEVEMAEREENVY